jgi:hypothetical protein
MHRLYQKKASPVLLMLMVLMLPRARHHQPRMVESTRHPSICAGTRRTRPHRIVTDPRDSGGGRRSHGSPVHPVEGRRRGPEPRSVRIQSRLRLRPAMRPTARTRSWPAHCSGQRGPKLQRSKAARRHEAPSEPRPTASKRRPVRPPRTRGTRARRDGSHSVDRHADSE